jgi:hypothetical protein
VADAGRVMQEGQAQQHLSGELRKVLLWHYTDLQAIPPQEQSPGFLERLYMWPDGTQKQGAGGWYCGGVSLGAAVAGKAICAVCAVGMPCLWHA